MISMDMKQLNRKTVFDIVKKHRTITRVELSEMTGMSGPSIMAIVNEFIEKGILVPAGKKSGAIGRSPVTMVFNPDVMLSIGIEFEGNTLSAGLVNLDGEIRFQTMGKVPANLGEPFFEALYKSIDKLEEMMSKEGLTYSGIGIGIPGAVSPKEEIIYFAPYVGVLEPRSIADQVEALKNRYGKPVFIENDVNASTIGEYYISGNKEEQADLLYIALGAGIGAGIILEGKLRHGARGLCGEIGYSLKDAKEMVTRKQTGWLEKNLSYEVLCEKFKEYQNAGVVSRQMADYIADTLSPFIANLVNTLDMNRVVIGGQMVLDGGTELIRCIREKVCSLSLSEVDLTGCHTEYTGVVGSALLASDQLWNTIL